MWIQELHRKIQVAIVNYRQMHFVDVGLIVTKAVLRRRYQRGSAKVIPIMFGVSFGLCSFLSVFIITSHLYTSVGSPPKDAAPPIVFAGKVVNSTGEWPNNRLVLVYLKGKEIGRAVTKTGEFSDSRQGIHDGLFVIKVDNIYGVDTSAFKLINSSAFTMTVDRPTFGRPNYIYHWFSELPEESLTYIAVPSKNIKYAIKVVPGDTSTLPQEMMTAGSTELKANNEIVVSPLPQTAGQSTTTAETNNVLGAVIRGVKYNVNTETIQTSKATVPMNNCGGSEKVTQDRTYSQTFLHAYRTEVSANAGIHLPIPEGWPQLLVELQAKYGFEQNQVDARTESYHMEAAPGTDEVYVITWKEVWEAGAADVLHGQDVITVPFRVKTNVIASIDSSSLPCH